MESWIQNKASGQYRWEKNPDRYDNIVFERGDAIEIQPFPGVSAHSKVMWPVYGTFIEYETPRICRVEIPPESNDSTPTWFKGETGEYYFHEGYIYPQ